MFNSNSLFVFELSFLNVPPGILSYVIVIGNIPHKSEKLERLQYNVRK